MILGHHFRKQMAMVVDNGHLSRMVVIQVLSHLGLKNKVIVVELLHNLIVCFIGSLKICAKILNYSQKNTNFAQKTKRKRFLCAAEYYSFTLEVLSV
jgi:hypothetical protein